MLHCSFSIWNMPWRGSTAQKNYVEIEVYLQMLRAPKVGGQRDREINGYLKHFLSMFDNVKKLSLMLSSLNILKAFAVL